MFLSSANTIGVVQKGIDGQIAFIEEQYQAYDYTNNRIAAWIVRRFINGYIPTETIQIIEDLEKVCGFIGFEEEGERILKRKRRMRIIRKNEKFSEDEDGKNKN